MKNQEAQLKVLPPARLISWAQSVSIGSLRFLKPSVLQTEPAARVFAVARLRKIFETVFVIHHSGSIKSFSTVIAAADSPMTFGTAMSAPALQMPTRICGGEEEEGARAPLDLSHVHSIRPCRPCLANVNRVSRPCNQFSQRAEQLQRSLASLDERAHHWNRHVSRMLNNVSGVT